MRRSCAFALCLLGVLVSAPAAPAEVLWTTGLCSPTFDGCSQVWRANDDGSNARVVLTNAWSARFDATGSRIVFMRTDGIYVSGADGSNPRRVTPPRSERDGSYDANPVFSPDGTLIAFDSNRPDGGPCRRVWLVDSAGATEPRPLPGSVCGDRLPRFSPAGTHILGLQYDEFGLGSPSLVARPTAGGPAVEVLSQQNDIGPFSLAFSPDGRAITFETQAGLTTLDLLTGRRLVTTQGGEPEWSPVGPALFYVGRTESGNAVIIRFGADGRAIRVSPGTHNDSSPSWAPIGLDLPPLPLVDTIGPLVANLADRVPVGLPTVALPPPARSARAAAANGPVARAAAANRPVARAAAKLPPRIAAAEITSIAAIDPSGVRTLEASAALESGRRCRFVVARGVARKRTSCRPGTFFPVSTAALRDRFEKLPEGNYRVWLRATDGVGNRAPVRLLRVAV